MIHRVAYQALGNGERMDEGGHASVTSYFTIDSTSRIASQRLRLSMELNFPPIVLAFGPATQVRLPSVPLFVAPLAENFSTPQHSLAPLASSLEAPLFLATFAMHNATASVVRIVHADEEASPAQFDLQQLLDASFGRISELDERSATLLKPARSARRHWHTEEEESHELRAAGNYGQNGADDAWQPTQIRSWFVEFARQE